MAALSARLAAEKIPVDLTDADSLGAGLRAYAARFPPILLVVDQFEELLTLCHDPAERERYAEALVRAARSADDRVRVVITLRDDFLVRAEQIAALRDRLAQGLQLLATPSPEDLLRILVEPARRRGYEFDDRELPPAVVRDVADRNNALALLSFAAAQLWELRDRHFKQLPRKAYEAMGGVGGALAAHAEATLTDMPAEEQRVVREVFRHLVTAEGTRAVLARAELLQVLGPAGERVVEKLIRARLLAASEQSEIDIVHEALLGAWPRLVQWRRDDAEGARLRDQLRAAARQWDERGRPRGLLWRQEALAEYQLWRPRYPGALTDVEEAFGRASVRDAARGRRVRTALVTAIVAALGVGVVILSQANHLANESKAKLHDQLVDSHEEQGRQAFLAGDPARALLYLSKAHEEGRDDVALRYLVARSKEQLPPQRPVLRHDDHVWAAAFSPDGARVVTGSADHTAALWDAATGARLATLRHDDVVYGVAFSPDGKLVATASWDGSARLWDAATGTLVRRLPHENRVYHVAFSRDGTRLVTPSRDGTAAVWDVATGARVLSLGPHPAQVDVAELSPDGTRVLTAARDGVVRLWSAGNGALQATLPAGPAAEIVSVWSPDSALVATFAAESETAIVWDATSGRELHHLMHADPLTWLQFLPDGELLTIAGDARLWNAATGEITRILRSPQGSLTWAVPDARHGALVTVGDDYVIRIWDIVSSAMTATYEGSSISLPIAVDPAGRRILTSSDRTVELWPAPEPDRHHAFRAHDADAVACAFSADDARLLSAGKDRKVALWDPHGGPPVAVLSFDARPLSASLAPDGRHAVIGLRQEVGPAHVVPVLVVASLEPDATRTVLAGHTADVNHAEWSADGTRVLSASADGTARIWDARRGVELLRIDAGERLWTARFSPDGRRVLTTGARTARVWDASDGHPLFALEGHTQSINFGVFSRDGRLVLTGSDDETAIVWDAATGGRFFSLLGHRSGVQWGDFSPDGTLAITGGQDGARMWDVTRGRLLQLFAGSRGVGGVAFAHDGHRVAYVSDDGVVNIWRLDATLLDDLTMFVRCRIPLRLEQELIVPSPTSCF
jgi:WD40 repeat protein